MAVEVRNRISVEEQNRRDIQSESEKKKKEKLIPMLVELEILRDEIVTLGLSHEERLTLSKEILRRRNEIDPRATISGRFRSVNNTLQALTAGEYSSFDQMVSLCMPAE